MARKTKNIKPAPRYRWERDPANNEFSWLWSKDFDSPGAALADARRFLPQHALPGRYHILVGESTEVPVTPDTPGLRNEIKRRATALIDNMECRFPKPKQGHTALVALLVDWVCLFGVELQPRVSHATAEHWIIEVPAKTEAYPTVAVALDQCLRGKLPPDVRRLLRQARQKLLETP